MQETEERFSGIEDSLEEKYSSAQENDICNKFLTQKIQEIWDMMKISNKK